MTQPPAFTLKRAPRRRLSFTSPALRVLLLPVSTRILRPAVRPSAQETMP
jgi:hypothetical protein